MIATLMHVVKFERILCNKHITWYTSQIYFKIYGEQTESDHAHSYTHHNYITQEIKAKRCIHVISLSDMFMNCFLLDP